MSYSIKDLNGGYVIVDDKGEQHGMYGTKEEAEQVVKDLTKTATPKPAAKK